MGTYKASFHVGVVLHDDRVLFLYKKEASSGKAHRTQGQRARQIQLVSTMYMRLQQLVYLENYISMKELESRLFVGYLLTLQTLMTH